MTSLVSHRKLSLFVLLSLADLALTFLLLEQKAGGAYEWNPLAAWWLARWGWAGLAGFKAAIVLLVLVLTGIVSRHRPRIADRILIFGCATLLVVIIHSGCLMPRVYSDADYAEAIQAESRHLDRQVRNSAAHTKLIFELSKDLAARRCSLSEAIQILDDAEMVPHSEWLPWLARRFPGFSTNELLGIRLIEEAVHGVIGTSYEVVQLYRDLNEEFRSCFDRSAPRFAVVWEDERIVLE